MEKGLDGRGAMPLHQSLTSAPTLGVPPAPDGQRQAEHLCLQGRCLETSTSWYLEKSQETGSSQEGAFRHDKRPGGLGQKRHRR